jgi:hypothetical protein
MVDFLLRLSADKVIELLEARNWSSERIEGGVEGQSAHCTEDYTKLKGGTSRQQKGPCPRLRLYPEGIPAAGRELHCVPALIED